MFFIQGNVVFTERSIYQLQNQFLQATNYEESSRRVSSAVGAC